ncbi:DNA-binding protein rif1 [Mactra antiquata]
MTNQVSPDASVTDILRSLESKTTVDSERSETYAKFLRNFRENDVSLFGLDVLRNINRVLTVIRTDASSNCVEVASGALQILGACLYDTEVVGAINSSDGESLVSMLCSIILKTEEKTVCACALWCLKSQNLDDTFIRDQIEDIMACIEHSIDKWSGSSVSVIHECINTIDRLICQVNNEMCKMSCRWGKLLVPLVVHGAVRVRERALDVIDNARTVLKDNMKALATSLKPLIQQELHHSSYINEFLRVVELGFKSTDPHVKIMAFQAWQQLIDNFALTQAVLQDPKRVKLIMQVFKHNNARNENVAMEKLSCWWHFIWLLGGKVSPNFDLVGAPLLQFCVGGKSTDHNDGTTPKMIKPGASPVTPHLKLTGSGSLQYPVFKSLQLRGCEVLARFLGSTNNESIDYDFNLDVLRHEVITGPSFFIKNSTLFINSATELFCTLGKDVPDSLIIHIWEWLIIHMKTAIDSPSKLDVREPLNTLLQQFQVVVHSKSVTDHIILKMLWKLSGLPKRILSSTAYSIGGCEMVNGTPGLYLMGLLLTPNLLESCADMETFQAIFESLLNSCAGHLTCTLGFLHSVMDLMVENSRFLEKTEVMGHLWSAVVTSFLAHVNESNEINQGDSLEHNFQCSVQIITLPVIQRHHFLQQASLKSWTDLHKIWTELYKTVNRLAAMVTNADGNVICEEVCSKILGEVKDDGLKEPELVSMVTQMCLVITNCLDFSSVGQQSAFNIAGLSPQKWSKKKKKPLDNIHSLVQLIASLLQRITELVSETDTQKKSSAVSLQAVLNSLTDMLSTIFVHVTSSNVMSHLMGQLACPIGNMLNDASKKTHVKVYNNAFFLKVEKLWADICTCLQTRYTSMFDSELLLKLSPLLETTFLHSRRQIKNLTLSLWCATFSKAASLDYPESLKPVLEKVKVKSSIQLPGWVHEPTIVIQDTPVSQMTQSQAPEPVIPGMPSPHKIHGSFLHKPVSPSMKGSSPVKNPVISPAPKKKVPLLNSFDDGDFVVIVPTSKKKMLLTDHQKEVLKEKRDIPAMYNSLEQSMDGSLMAAHFTTDTQMDGTLSETPTPTSQPVSLFGSIIPPTGQDQKTAVKAKESSSFQVPDSTPEASGNISSLGQQMKSTKTVLVASKDNTDTDKTEIIDKERSDSIDSSSGKTVTNADKNKSQSESSSISSKSDDFVALSVPQNILGAIGNEIGGGYSLPSTIKSSDEEVKSSPSVVHVSIVTTEENELREASSEPLLSWTQKLNELNNSPKPVKKSFSQDSSPAPAKVISVRKSAKSPAKNAKKITDENKGSGPLSKWVIRSPMKNVMISNQPVELTVAHVSQTLVEETQSPTKFKKMAGKGDPNSPSIMETPPKNVLETISVNHSNSSRKLFDVEDSNMVPASPNSKSFTVQTGTPVIKLKKLTDNDILIHSPSRVKDHNVNEEINGEKVGGSAKKVILESDDAPVTQNTESSHAHDDFSVFKPLDNEPKKDEEVLNVITKANSLVDEVKHADNTIELSGSENLFSQDVVENKKPELTDEEQAEVKNSQDDVNDKETPVEMSQSSQDESSSQDDSQTSTCTTRSRKRKQITPKKLTPENNKRRKTVTNSNKGSARKIITRKGQANKSDSEDAVNNKSLELDSQESIKVETVSPAKGVYASTRRRTNDRKSNDIGKEQDSSELSQDKKVITDDNDITDSVNTVEDNSPSLLDHSSKGPDSKTEKEAKEDDENNEKSDLASSEGINGDVDMVELKEDADLKDGSHSDTKFDVDIEKLSPQTEIVGQKTPESQKNSERKEPERTSTTKHKKLVAKKMNLRRSKEVITVDSDEESTSEVFEDNKNDKLANNKNESELDGKGTEIDGKDNELDNKKENIPDNTKSGSSDSDDDIPLLQIHEKIKDKKEKLKNTSNSGKKNKMKVGSSPSMSIQTRRSANTRLRSGAKVRSPQAKKCINLAIKRSKRSKNKEKEEIDPSKDEVDGDMKDVDNGNVEKSVTEIVDKENNKSDDNVEANVKNDESDEVRRSPRKSLKKTVEAVDSNNTAVDEQMEETPKKHTVGTKSNMASMLMMRNSDSKLVVGSRRFERKGAIARRSILKPSASESSDMSISPQRPFHPIEVARIYSPTASPSASILKRRRLNEDPVSDTNSPPAKQRRVSFASPLDDSNCEIAPSDIPCSPLATCKTNKEVTTDVIDAGTSIDEKAKNGDNSELTQSSKSLETQSTQGSPSQRVYESSQETQNDGNEPIYPDLIGCDQDVQKILPQLTSSVWCRGLGQLVRARNIHTIGDLSALSENDVHGLPIKSPKVVTVKQVLKKYGQVLDSAKNKTGSKGPKMQLESKWKTEVPEECKTKEGNIKTENTKTNQEKSESDDKLIHTEVESLLASSGDLVDEVERLSQGIDQSGDRVMSCDHEIIQSVQTSKISNRNFVETLSKLNETCEQDVKCLSADELVKASRLVTQILTNVNKGLANIVTNKCSASNR